MEALMPSDKATAVVIWLAMALVLHAILGVPIIPMSAMSLFLFLMWPLLIIGMALLCVLGAAAFVAAVILFI
jgi:hypothetical protein